MQAKALSNENYLLQNDHFMKGLNQSHEILKGQSLIGVLMKKKSFR